VSVSEPAPAHGWRYLGPAARVALFVLTIVVLIGMMGRQSTDACASVSRLALLGIYATGGW